MSVHTQPSSRIYRFHDEVALCFADTETLYLSQDHAAQLGGLLARYAEDIIDCKFVNSQLHTDGWDEDKRSPWKGKSHWDDHPDYAAGDWQIEVEAGDTRQSYTEWVNSRLEDEDDN